MHYSRRKFLQTSALTVAALSFKSRLLANFASPEVLAIQLYSLRDDMSKDPKNTLKQLADIGYKNVEHANYVDRKFYGYSPKEFKNILGDLGLRMPSGHVSFGPDSWDSSKNDFTDKWKYTVEDAIVAGQQFVISPWMDESFRKDYDGLLKVLELFNQCGAYCKKAGVTYGYHNHNFEFNTRFKGKLIYDIILEKTDPDLVAQQMDMGNMYGAGGIGLDILKKYPNRFKLFHVKDEIKSKTGEMHDGFESTVIGKGILPVKKTIDYARKYGGTSYFIIEQESYQDLTPIASAKADYEIMKKWGY